MRRAVHTGQRGLALVELRVEVRVDALRVGWLVAQRLDHVANHVVAALVIALTELLRAARLRALNALTGCKHIIDCDHYNMPTRAGLTAARVLLEIRKHARAPAAVCPLIVDHDRRDRGSSQLRETCAGDWHMIEYYCRVGNLRNHNVFLSDACARPVDNLHAC